MMDADIYSKAKSGETVDVFYAAVCDILGLQSGQERESSNVAGGRYFRTRALGVIVKVEEADSPELSDFDFCTYLSARADWKRAAEAIDALGDIVAKELALAGYEVVRRTGTLSSPPGTRRRRRFVARMSDNEVDIFE